MTDSRNEGSTSFQNQAAGCLGRRADRPVCRVVEDTAFREIARRRGREAEVLALEARQRDGVRQRHLARREGAGLVRAP